MTSNINLQDYYSKISEMRNKILSKHQPNQGTSTKISQITFSENINTYVPPIRQPNIINNGPLAETNDNRRIINCRVKELDDINDKIKSMLAYKRSVQKTNTFIGERSNSIHKNERNIDYKLKMPQTIISQPKNKFEIISDKREYSRNLRQQLRQNTQTAKYQSTIPLLGQRFIQKPTNIIQKSLKQYNLPANQRLFEANTTSFPFNKAISQDYIENFAQTSIQSPQRQKMVKLLIKQIQIDRKIQQTKQNFEYYSNPDKFSTLISFFSRKNSKISKEQIQSWTKFHPQQSNPFLAIVSISSFNFDEFSNQVIEAKQHWEHVVKQSLSIANLQRQCFTITEIDPQAKGFISIEDLVCYLNINSPDAFLRNRDIFSLFKRLKGLQRTEIGQNRLEYETFLNFIAK